jgi:hypothetical protein
VRGFAVVCVLVALGCGRVRFDALTDASDATTGDGGGDSGDGPAFTHVVYVKSILPFAGAEYGHAVAVSADGGTVAFGAPLDQNPGLAAEAGSVWIYRRTGDVWSFEASVYAQNGDAFDQFGWSLGLSSDGGLLAVGARREDSGGAPADNSVPNAGAVYTFTRSVTNTWSQQAYLKASNPGQDDNFGEKLALSGDGSTLAVSAFYEDSASRVIDSGQADNTATDAGAVYVFTRSGTTWTPQAYLKTATLDAGDEFGSAVALSTDGNTLVAGAVLEDAASFDANDNTLSNAGPAFLFTRSGTVWSQQAYFKATSPMLDANFGYSTSVAPDGDHVALGAVSEASGAGGVYSYTGSGATLAGPFRFDLPGAEPDDQVGFSVAIAGPTAAVGAMSDDGPGNALPGCGAVYVASAGSVLRAPNADAGDQFGWAIALSGTGDVLVVGAPAEDSAASGVAGDQASNALTDSGAAYIFY